MTSIGLGMPAPPAPVLAPRRKTRQLMVGDVGVGERKARHAGERAARQPLDERDRLGALDRDQRGGVADVLDLAQALRVLAEPVEILRGVRRVDDHVELVVGALVEDAVVDDAAGRPAQQGVDRLAGGRARHRVGGQPLDRLAGARAAQVGLAHVAHVEQADRLADRLVLLDRPRGIGDRHVPAAEVDEARAGVAVLLPEGRTSALGGGAHGADANRSSPRRQPQVAR